MRGAGAPLSRGLGGANQVRQALEPLVDGRLGVHDDLELAAGQPSYTALARAERDDHVFAMHTHGIDDGEDLVDLVHADRVEHGSPPRRAPYVVIGSRSMSRRIALALALVLLAGPVAPVLAADVPLADAHIHYSAPDWSVYSPDQVVAILDRAGIRRALVSSTPDDGKIGRAHV